MKGEKTNRQVTDVTTNLLQHLADQEPQCGLGHSVSCVLLDVGGCLSVQGQVVITHPAQQHSAVTHVSTHTHTHTENIDS